MNGLRLLIHENPILKKDDIFALFLRDHPFSSSTKYFEKLTFPMITFD